MAEQKIRRQMRWYRHPETSAESIPITKREFESLPAHGQGALLEALGRFKRGGERGAEVQKFHSEKGYPTINELRVQVGSDPFRILFFQDSPVHHVMLIAVYKNQKKLPKPDKDRAIKRMKSWRDAARQSDKGTGA